MRVVDQVDEAVPAPVFLSADEELAPVRSVGVDAGLGQVAGLADDRVGFARTSGRTLRRRRRGSSARPSRRRRTGSASGSLRSAPAPPGRGRRRPAWRRRRSPAGCASSCGTRAGRWGTCAATLPARRRVRRSPGRRRRRWRGSRRRGRARAASGREDLARSRRRAGRAGRAGRRGSRSSRSTSRRTGLARLTSLLDVFAAAGEAGAEFVEDEPEALRVGQRLDVVDQVRVDAGAVVARAAAGTGPRRARRRGSPSAAAAARCPGARGRVGRQSTNFSPISDCGRIMAAGVAGGSPGSRGR